MTAITSPSCVNIAPAALNCTVPSTLTFYVTGIPAGVIPGQVDFLLFYDDEEEVHVTGSSYVRNANGSVTALAVSLYRQGWLLALMGLPLTVLPFKMGNLSNAGTPLVGGLSFALVPPPFLSGISGCVGEGPATLDCVVDRDVLTLYGTGLSFFRDQYGYDIDIGSFTYNTNGEADTRAHGVIVVSDSQLLMPLNRSYAWVLPPIDYTEVVLPLSFNLRWYVRGTQRYHHWHTNSVNVSFAPIPPPLVQGVSGCTKTANGTALVDCAPELSVVRFTGHYLYGANITLSAAGLGSYRCEQPSSRFSPWLFSTQADCILPIIPDDSNGQAWDVSLVTSAGALFFPQLVTFTTIPSITSMVLCTPSFSTLDPTCAPGDTLTIRGQRFPVGGTVLIYLTTNPYRWGPSVTVNVSCAASAIVSVDTLTCLIPYIDPSIAPLFYGMPNQVVAVFPGLQYYRTNALASWIVAYPDVAVLTSVSGCEASNGLLAVQRCRGGDVLTIVGTNLNCTGAIVWGRDDFRERFDCDLLPNCTATRAQCQLVNATEESDAFRANVSYRMTWVPPRLISYSTIIESNFFVSWTWDPLPEPSAPQQDKTEEKASEGVLVTAIVVPVVVLVVALAVWFRYRREARICRKEGLATEAETTNDGSSSMNHFGLLRTRSSAVELQ